jgi:hypothetical protein
MKKVVLPFLLTILFSSYVCAEVEVPEIRVDMCGELEVEIAGQKQLGVFFEKIERGKKLGASHDDRIYYEKACRLKSINCDASNPECPDVPEEDKIRELPSEIGEFTELECIDLCDNKITKFPPEFWTLPHLSQLSLGKNGLTRIPPEIGQLKNLKELSLVCNELAVLPKEIENLTNLKKLHLDWNKFVTFPTEIGKLTALMTLTLECNKLETLPSDIGNLVKLSYLDLTGNKLVTLPQEIMQCNLMWLLMDSNNIKSLPEKVIEGIKTIRCVIWPYDPICGY